MKISLYKAKNARNTNKLCARRRRDDDAAEKGRYTWPFTRVAFRSRAFASSSYEKGLDLQELYTIFWFSLESPFGAGHCGWIERFISSAVGLHLEEQIQATTVDAS